MASQGGRRGRSLPLTSGSGGRSGRPVAVVTSIAVVTVAGTAVWLIIRQRRRSGGDELPESLDEAVEETRDGQRQSQAEMDQMARRSADISA